MTPTGASDAVASTARPVPRAGGRRGRRVAAAAVPLSFAAATVAGVAVPSARPAAWTALVLPIALAALRLGPVAASAVGALAVAASGLLTPAGASPWTLPVVMAVVAAAFVGMAVERQRIDDERRRLAAERSEVDAQRATLLQTVSHEFRLPLTLVLGATELLDRRTADATPQTRHLVGILDRAARRLSDLVSVVVAAVEAADDDVRPGQAPVDVERAVAEVASTLPVERRERLRIVVSDGAERLVSVPAYVSVLLRTLVDNALKFSPDGEPVDVHVERRVGEVVIRVRDRGPGLPPHVGRARAFAAFVQGDGSDRRPAGGLGVGLYTAERLAGRLGATVDLRDPPGGGCEAVVILPQRREADAQQAVRPS